LFFSKYAISFSPKKQIYKKILPNRKGGNKYKVNTTVLKKKTPKPNNKPPQFLHTILKLQQHLGSQTWPHQIHHAHMTGLSQN